MSDFDLLNLWVRMRRAQDWYRYLLDSRTSSPIMVSEAMVEAAQLEMEWGRRVAESRSGLVTLF